MTPQQQKAFEARVILTGKKICHVFREEPADGDKCELGCGLTWLRFNPTRKNEGATLGRKKLNDALKDQWAYCDGSD